MTVTAPERRPHGVEHIHLFIDLDSGLPVLEPVLAGAGDTLAYSGPLAVRRVVGGKPHRSFGFEGPRGLAVNRGRIAVVGQQLRPGDGCGCVAGPDWSPDGRRIAFLTGKFSVDNVGPVGIGVMNADGSGRTVLVNDGLTRTALDWSPDGTKLAYSYFRLNPYAPAEIAASEANGANAHDLAPGADPTWSPDGATIAFERPVGGRPQVFVMDANGGNARQLTNTSVGTSSPAWSPDGTRIAYDSGGLHVMSADGTGDRLLVAPFGGDPDWSPDGRRILVAATNGIAVVNADGQDFHFLTHEFDQAPKWSPDGRTILFASLRNDLRHNEELDLELFAMDADGRNVRPLSFSEPQAWTSPGQIRSGTGKLLASFAAAGMPTGNGVVLGGGLVAVLTRSDFDAPPRIELFDSRTGARRGSVDLRWDGGRAALGGIRGHRLVYYLNGRIRTLDARGLARTVLAAPHGVPIGLSVAGTRVAWAEKLGQVGRIRDTLLSSD